jgi:rRNA maturation protein Nop10
VFLSVLVPSKFQISSQYQAKNKRRTNLKHQIDFIKLDYKNVSEVGSLFDVVALWLVLCFGCGCVVRLTLKTQGCPTCGSPVYVTRFETTFITFIYTIIIIHLYDLL